MNADNLTIGYSTMVANLKKPAAEILASLTEEKCDLIHMVFGICGEVGELLDADTPANQEEEFGDLYFYLEGLLQNQSIKNVVGSLEVLMGTAPVSSRAIILTKLADKGAKHCLYFYSAELLDTIKKHVVYCKPLDADKVKFNMIGVFASLADFSMEAGIVFDEAKRANMKKLLTGKNARYASGAYSDQQAQDRADKKEGE